jgi:hypothetical protein
VARPHQSVADRIDEISDDDARLVRVVVAYLHFAVSLVIQKNVISDEGLS